MARTHQGLTLPQFKEAIRHAQPEALLRDWRQMSLSLTGEPPKFEKALRDEILRRMWCSSEHCDHDDC